MQEKITVEELVRKHGRPLTRKGGLELIFPCPKCKHVKFEINIDKNVFHCFRCGTSGKVWVTGKNYYTEFRQTVEKNVDVFNVPGFKQFGKYWPLPESSIWWNYFKSRGVSYDSPLLRICGSSTDPKLKGRLIIPIIENGKMVAAVARSIDSKKPKELFLGEAKGNVLYNLDTVMKDDWRHVIIVEGVFDSEAVRRAGFISVAVLGSNITDVQVGKLLAKRPYGILIMMDNDQAGREGAIKIFKKLRERFNGFTGIVSWRRSPMLTGFKDPGECPTYVIDEAVRIFATTDWEKR